MIGSLSSNNNNPIGSLGKKEVSRYNELARKIDEINTEIDDLESQLAQIESSNTVDKEYGNIQSIQSNSIVNEDTITTDVIRARLTELNELQSILIRASSVSADNLYGQIKDVQNETTVNTLHSNSIDVANLRATNATLENVELTNIDANDVKTNSAEITNAVIDSEQVDSSTIYSANVRTLESETITSHSIDADNITSDSANIDEVTSKEIIADEVKAGVLENSNLIGYNVISLGNLTPLDNDDDQQFYCLKLKKPFEKMTLKWPGSFECIVQSAMAKPETELTHSASVIWLHQKQLNEVLRVSEDEDYIYIDIAPFNSNEDTRLYYKVEAEESLEDRITYSINEHPVYDFYYNPLKLSEVIIAGDGTEKYQLTVLGKLWAKISPDFENTVFEDITVNNNIYTKDYFNTVSGEWEYKKGGVNDYLSNIENGIDEETGEQKTRIDWRKRVAFRVPADYVLTTEDSTEDVLVDDTKVGERVVKANVNTLTDLGTLRNYNGQWLVPAEYTEHTGSRTDFHTSIPSTSRNPSQDLADAGFTPTLYSISDVAELYKTTLTDGYYFKDDSTDEYKLAKYLWMCDTVGSGKPGDILFLDEDGKFIHSAYEEREGSSFWPNQIKYYTRGSVTTVNPITKLGTVDEGTWVAGDVTTPNLVANTSTVLNTTTTINDDLHITEDVLDFGGTNYDVWDYVNDNMNWVEE